MARRWEPGEHAVLRLVGNDNGYVLGYPQVVVRDEPDLVVLFQPAGVEVRNHRHGGPDHRTAVLGGGPIPPSYTPPMHIVRWMPAGATHAVEMFFDGGRGTPGYLRWLDAGGWFRGWKVNLQSRFRRTVIGFDTTDNALDLVMARDRAWRWKDAEQVERRVAAGLTTPEEARAFREEAERVIQTIERGNSPFDDRWESWRPDPGWTAPALPDGWEREPGYDVDLNRTTPATGSTAPR